MVDKISAALKGLKDDNGAQAQAVRDRLGISGYIPTTVDDFKHTLSLLQRAGVNRRFNFSF